jgi:hypothetical protein
MGVANKKLLFFFNHPTKDDEAKILQGEIPSDRLYGLVELKARGWLVDACDERLTPWEFKFKPYISLINWACVRKAIQFDIWIVKDNFSWMLTLLARLFGKEIIYIDSLFHMPNSRIRRLMIAINLRLAQRVGVYSDMQAKFWSSHMGVGYDKFSVFKYTIDTKFYLENYAQAPGVVADKPYVLAAGRDMGRDFPVLIEATARLGLKLKLVTLPYLLPADIERYSHVEVLQRIPYAQLFSLYKSALAVAVPLRGNMEYPSGIRAGLEGMLLGKPTICTESSVLFEYAAPADQVLFYAEADSVESWVNCLTRIQQMPQAELQALCQAAQQRVLNGFAMTHFVDQLEDVFSSMNKAE